MAKKTSPALIIFGVINIIVALVPPCAGCLGAAYYLNDPSMPLKNRDVGPEFKRHMDDKVPTAKMEAIAACVCNWLAALLLLGGAIGLFFAQKWAKWLTVAASVFTIFVFCVHDVYQFAILRPAVMSFLDQHLPPGPDRDGFKVGFTGSFFFWSCCNPVLLVYLIGMSAFLMATSAFDDRPRKKRRRFEQDDYDDDRAADYDE